MSTKKKIDMKMASQMESPTTIKERAETIHTGLETLQKKCSNRKHMKSISMKNLFMVLEYMAEHLCYGQISLFQEDFISHLRVLTILTEHRISVGFDKYFLKISELLCELCPAIGAHDELLYGVLRQWRLCVKNMPSTVHPINVERLKKCAQCLVIASRISMQQILLEIVYAYCEHAKDGPSKLLPTIFQDIPLLSDNRGDYFASITNNFVDMQWFLYHFNRRLSQQKIHSEMVWGLRFGDEIIDCDAKNERFVHFNENSIEFWIPYDVNNGNVGNGTNLKVVIEASVIKKVLIEDDDTPYVKMISFELSDRVRFENAEEMEVAPANLQKSNVITMLFMCGFQKNQLNQLLVRMLCIDADKLHEYVEIRTEIVSSSDVEMSDDDDDVIEFIPIEYETRRPLYSNRNQFHSQTKNEIPSESLIKQTELVKQTIQKASEVKRPKRKLRDKDSTVIDMSDEGELPSKTKSMLAKSTTPIEPSSKAAVKRAKSTVALKTAKTVKTQKKDVKKSPVQRPKRSASEMAKKKLANNESDEFDFDPIELPKKSKNKAPLKRKDEVAPILNPLRKRGNSTIDDKNVILVDFVSNTNSSDGEMSEKISITANSLTTAIASKSNFDRILQNASTINEMAKSGMRRDPIFSYRKLAAAKKPKPEDDENQGSHNENYGDDIDANGNIKKCKNCRRNERMVEDYLQNIGKVATKVNILDRTIDECYCGTSKNIAQT